MTRIEAIAIIEKALPTADEETLAAAARLLQGAQDDGGALTRELTPRELALIEQSKRDFAEGRTYSIDEARAYINEALARRRRQRGES